MGHSDGHGLCYEVRHDDGARAFYDPAFVPDLGETFYKAYSDIDPSDVEYLREREAEVLPEDGSFPSRFRPHGTPG